MTDTWNPDQYERFKAQRRQPFDDLLGLVRAVPGGRVVDLGCGTGELTAELHRSVGAAETVGVDSSTAMISRASPFAGSGVRFEAGAIESFPPAGETYDVVFANAALQWVPGHRVLLPRLAGALRPGGQLAVQVPANFDHPSHTVALAVGREFGAAPAHSTEAVLAPEEYAAILHSLGFAEQRVRLEVYGHPMASSADVVEWVKGTLLTDYERQLGPDRFASFLEEYRSRLLAVLGDGPYFYAFKRILFWAQF